MKSAASRRKASNEKFDAPKKVAMVTWEDAWYDDDVHTEESIAAEQQSCVLYSVGFLMREDSECVTLAMDFGDGTARHVQRIRKENIRKIQMFE